MENIAQFLPMPVFAIILGIVSAIPLGPAGLFVVDSTITGGFKKFFPAMFGFILAELAYMSLALGGYNYFSSNSSLWNVIASGIAAPVILFLGLRLVLQSQDANKKAENQIANNTIFKSFLITISNPTLLIFYLGILTSFSVISNSFSAQSRLMFLIVFQFAGTSTLALLALWGYRERERIYRKLGTLRQVAGTMLSVYGVFLIYRVSHLLKELS